MRRLLLSPRWLARSVLVVVCFVGFLALGWWQWRRAHEAGGGLQNLGYALQWPLFAAFAVFGWWKMLRLDLDRSKTPDGPAAAEQSPVSTTPAWHYEPPTVDDDSDDEELAAYNRHLAWLNAQDGRAEPNQTSEQETHP